MACNNIILYLNHIGWEEFDEDDGHEYDDEEDNDGYHEVESVNVLPWYVTAVKSLIEIKEEAESDLTCDVNNDYGKLKLNGRNIYQGKIE